MIKTLTIAATVLAALAVAPAHAGCHDKSGASGYDDYSICEVAAMMALIAYGDNQCWAVGDADCYGQVFGLSGAELMTDLASALGGCKAEEIGCLVQACKAAPPSEMCGIEKDAFDLMEACSATAEGAASCAIASIPELELYLIGSGSGSGSGR